MADSTENTASRNAKSCSSREPVPGPAREPVQDPSMSHEPVPGPASEPVQNPSMSDEPVPGPAREPVQDPSMSHEPVPEPTREPVQDSSMSHEPVPGPPREPVQCPRMSGGPVHVRGPSPFAAVPCIFLYFPLRFFTHLDMLAHIPDHSSQGEDAASSRVDIKETLTSLITQFFIDYKPFDVDPASVRCSEEDEPIKKDTSSSISSGDEADDEYEDSLEDYAWEKKPKVVEENWEICSFPFCDQPIIRTAQMHLHFGEIMSFYLCTECWYPSVDPLELNVHQLEHKEFKLYYCPYDLCGKRFNLVRDLEDHCSFHCEGDPYMCPLGFCEARFLERDDLLEHMYAHM